MPPYHFEDTYFIVLKTHGCSQVSVENICKIFTRLPLVFFRLLVNSDSCLCSAIGFDTNLAYLKHFPHDLVTPGLMNFKHSFGESQVCLSSQGCLIVSPVANVNRLGLDFVLALCPQRSFACLKKTYNCGANNGFFFLCSLLH